MNIAADLTAVSLFDGIGGFPLALSRAGIRTTAAVEIDKAAAGVAACHFPDMTHFSDVTEVTGDQLIATGFDPARGIVTAGWPCTDLSLAGLRLGLGGARSGLVGEIFRLLAELRPRWVLLENVPGLLSSVCPCPGGGICDAAGCADGPHVVGGGACGRRGRRGRLTGAGRCMALHGGGMGTVLWTLGQLGYGVAYRVLDAQHFGVPQQRRRVVIVGCFGDRTAPVEVLLEPDSSGGDPAPGDPAGQGTSGTSAVRVADCRRQITGSLTAREGKGPDSDVTTTLIASGTNRSNPQPGGPAPALAVASRAVAFGLRADPGGTGQGHNTNYGTVAGGTTHALTSEGADASEDGAGRGTPVVAASVTAKWAKGVGGPAGDETQNLAPVTAQAVRRLTPMECERLQGFPDGWTAHRRVLIADGSRWMVKDPDALFGADQTDSPRYRQLGNSIAVPVFEWVARRIAATEAAIEVTDIGAVNGRMS